MFLQFKFFRQFLKKLFFSNMALEIICIYWAAIQFTLQFRQKAWLCFPGALSWALTSCKDRSSRGSGGLHLLWKSFSVKQLQWNTTFKWELPLPCFPHFFLLHSCIFSQVITSSQQNVNSCRKQLQEDLHLQSCGALSSAAALARQPRLSRASERERPHSLIGVCRETILWEDPQVCPCSRDTYGRNQDWEKYK